MKLQGYDPHRRYRKRSAERFRSFTKLFVFFIFSFSTGYWIGEMRSEQNLILLQEERAALENDFSKAQNDMTELRANAQTAHVRYEQLLATYEELVSDGDIRELVTLLRKQIEKGVSTKRLKSIVLSARPPQNCSDSKDRRFVVTTPVYSGPDSAIFVKSGEITIKGTGVSAKNASGKKEAWFDPNQPVTISFITHDGEVKVEKGVLPLYHSIITGDKEYRFTITKGPKSFAKISYDHCDYP